MKKGKRIVICTIIGAILSIMLTILTGSLSPWYVYELLPVFLGASVAGVCCGRKELLIGLTIAVISIFFSLLSFYIINTSMTDTFKLSSINNLILLQWAAYLPSGIIGAYASKLVPLKI